MWRALSGARLLALVLTLACARGSAAEYPRPKPGRAGKGRLEYVQGIPVLHLYGSPAEMGRQQGTLLAEQFAVLREHYLERFVRDGAQAEAAKLAAMGFQKFMPPDYLAEMKALSAASGQPYVSVLLANTFLDSARVLWCSVAIVRGEASKGGRLLFARNNDFPTFGIAHQASQLTVYHHAEPGRHSFVAIGWPGMVGVISGMNDAGLCAATLVSLTQRGVQPGMPYTLMYRQVLERCTTPQQALELVKLTQRTSANNLSLAAPGAEPLVIEFSPQKVAARRPIRDVLLCTNHFRSPVHIAKPWPVYGRYPKLAQLSEQHYGKIDVAALKQMLHACNQGGMTLQAMVFEPAERRLHLSVGSLPATSGRYVIIECGKLMSAK